MSRTAMASVRSFFVDALNVAWWCGSPPSLRLPLALATQLLERGHAVRLYFDASAPHRLGGDADVYAELRRDAEHFLEVPAGRRADGELLRHARASGACVISRDHYRDWRRRYRTLIDDAERRLAGFVREGRLLLPALAIDAPLPESTGAAWVQWRAVREAAATAQP